MGLLMKEATEISLNMSILNTDSFTLSWAWHPANTNILNQTASRAKHSEDLTLPNNPKWLLINHKPRVQAGIYMM